MNQTDPFHQLLTALRAYPNAMGADTLHGFLTGMAIGPDEIFDTPWLATLLGLPEERQDDADLEPIRDIAEWVIEDVLDALLTDELEPCVGTETRDGHVLPRTDLWCQGFVASVALADPQWRDWTEQDIELGKQLLAINVIADPSRNGTLLFDASVDLSSGAFLADLRPLAGQLAQRIVDRVMHLEDEGVPLSEDDADESEADPDSLPTFDEQELRTYAEQELMALIVTLGDTLPRSVIDAAARRGAKMLPLLAAHLMDAANWDDAADSDIWWALHHCLMILGAMDEPRAAHVLAGVFERVRSDPDNSLWEWFAGYWPALFRNKRGHATAPLRAVAEDRGIDWYGRIQALDCVIAAAGAAGAATLDPALDWAAAFASDPTEEETLRMSIGHMLLRLPRERHRALLEMLVRIQEEHNDMFLDFDRNDIEAAFARGDDPDWLRFSDPWEFYDTEQIMERQRRWAWEDEDDLDVWEEGDTPLFEPYVRATPKLGRNDPCPCGSGKKYKKCCMEKLH